MAREPRSRAAGTPAAIITRLNQDIAAILNSRQAQKRLLSFGVDRAPIDLPKEFADFLQTDIKRWSQLVREAGIKPEQ